MEIMNTMTSKAKIMVLFANTYEMKDDAGKFMSGCSVHYMFWGEYGENLLPMTEFNPGKPVGIQRAKCSMDIGLREKLVVAPAIYEGTFVTTVGGDGKPVLKLVDVAYLARVEIRAKILPGFVCPGMYSDEEAAEMLGLKTDKPADNKPAEAAKGSK